MTANVVDRVAEAERMCRQVLVSPVEGCLGLRLDAVDGPDGRVVTLRMPLPEGGAERREIAEATVLSVLTDVAGGLSVVLMRGTGLGAPTVELRLDHAEAPAPEARWVTADASVPYVVPGVGYATMTVRDDTGRLVGRGQGHYVLDSAAVVPASIPGGPLSVTDGDRGRPAALLADLEHTGDDPTDWELPLSTRMANARRQVQGGVLLAIGRIAQRRMQADARVRPLSIQAEYLRPAPIEDPVLRVRTSYERRGRRFRTLRTELVRADGRTATAVTGLWMHDSVTTNG